MSMTDPIADFLTRVRNGITAQHDVVEIPASGLTSAVNKCAGGRRINDEVGDYPCTQGPEKSRNFGASRHYAQPG